MKKHFIEIGIIVFAALFMRLTIMDNGFLLGFKDKMALEAPIQVVEYESQQHSWLRSFESRYDLIQVASHYSFVILGKYHNKWFFLEGVQ